MNAISMGAVDAEVNHSPAFAKCWFQFWVEPMFEKNSRSPKDGESIKTDGLLPELQPKQK